jgi:vacuolar-type H+-ATPase subunit I/STV1
VVLTIDMTINTVDKLIWVLIYAGLLVVCLGIFVKRSAEGLGWALIALGAVVAAAGAALVWVRSRMDPASDTPKQEPS